MKKLISMKMMIILLSSLTLGLSLTSCEEDEGPATTVAEAVEMTLSTSAGSLVMGDSLYLNFAVTNTGEVTNEDVEITLEAKAGEEDKSGIFNEFSPTVTFVKGDSTLKVGLQVVSTGLPSSSSFEIVAFSRGYTITGATQSILVSDYHYTEMGIKNNNDNVVKEGESFVLTARIAVPAAEAVLITITPDVVNFVDLPATLTIAVGETSVESSPITLVHDYINTGDKKLSIKLSTANTLYPLLKETFELTRQDIDTPLGEAAADERHVYPNPDLMFVSAKNKVAVEAWKVGEKYRLMAKNDPHPLLSGWNFYAAVEFHKIPSCYDIRHADAVSNGVYPPWGFASHSTVLAQKYSGVNNNKFSTIMDAGYLNMWCMKIATDAGGNSSGAREYGTAAFYANKCDSPETAARNWAQQHSRIHTGTRVETRARVRGNKKGFNMAIWLQGNEVIKWPLAGEVDIFENPASNSTDNRFFSTFHMGEEKGEDIIQHTEHNEIDLDNMSDWNIYWFELVDANTVKLGVNGLTTKILTKAEYPAIWPFDDTANPYGFHYILTMGVASEWALGEFAVANTPTAGWDSEFSSFTNYEQDRFKPEIPRMEIDWIRYYTNANFTSNFGIHATPFY